MINTRKVIGRRKLRFENFADALREAEALAAAEQSGTLRSLGNWTLGQAIGHIAFWADAPFDGYPDMPPLPWLLRVVVTLFKKPILNRGIPSGGKIPSVPGGTFGIDVLPTDEAIARLRRAFDRLAVKQPTQPNPVFGVMSHADWIKMNLRHAELHLGFFVPK